MSANNRKKKLVVLGKDANKKTKLQTEKPLRQPALDILHELQVHQEELEMQNAELLNVQSLLVKSIEDYTQLFNNAPIGYFILDKNGVIIDLNTNACTQFGSYKDQLQGAFFSTFLYTRSCQDEYYRKRMLALDTEEKQQVECQIKKTDGTVFWGLIECIPVKDGKNRFKHMLSTLSDISHQKIQEEKLKLALEKEKELNDMKSQFISIALHEFKTPLSTILTSTELLEKYNKPDDAEKRKPHFRKITTSVMRINEILIDFLGVGESEKESIKNNPENFDITEFIKIVSEETKMFNGIHKLTIQHIGKYTNAYLDKKLFKTCITNLFINAYKYSPKGGEIKIIIDQKTPHALTISISDQGIGIPINDQAKVFDLFFRAKNALNFQGTGLGLNIIKKLMVVMGGDVSFISKENEGTTFTLSFPQ